MYSCSLESFSLFSGLAFTSSARELSSLATMPWICRTAFSHKFAASGSSLLLLQVIKDGLNVGCFHQVSMQNDQIRFMEGMQEQE